jgi:hypothetical protein
MPTLRNDGAAGPNGESPAHAVLEHGTSPMGDGVAVSSSSQGTEAPHLPSLDPARERRVKALTCTEPLHSLQTNRGRRGWDRFDFYDLGLARDRCRRRQDGLRRGDRPRIARRHSRPRGETLRPRFARRSAQSVVRELAETLIRPNIGEYTSTLDEIRRRFDFTLLSEHENAEGGIYLRATNEGINVLVGGPNTDIESAQVAAEATLEHLVRRRRLDDAAKPAREAKIRSIQYSSFVRQVIEETKRDIWRAGWREDVPQRLAEIREHLRDRIRTEVRSRITRHPSCQQIAKGAS